MTKSSTRRRGRPPNPVPTTDWKLCIPIPIAAKIDIMLLDPVTGATRYGSRSTFVTQLLVEWLDKHAQKGGESNG